MKIIINRNKLMQIYTKKSDLPRKDVRKYHFNTIKLQLLNSHIANCITKYNIIIILIKTFEQTKCFHCKTDKKTV